MNGVPSRYSGLAATVEDGWTLTRLRPPSRLAGANGIRTAPDGRIWVASVVSSSISAIDPDSGAIDIISPTDGSIVAPDDLVFDDAGNLYCTEITEGRVTMRTPNGQVRVLHGDIPVANPITWNAGRLIAGECRMDARIMEMPLDGAAPRVIKDGIPMANAFDVGPDGRLYAPIMGANEIWAIDIATGAHEVVAGDLGVPDSVKFDSKGRIVSTQVASGDVLRIDVQSGQRELLAKLAPGLDNVAFVGERIFISSIDGSITEILAPGQTRPLINRGLQWPLGLAMGADGALFVCDGVYAYTLRPDGGGALDALQMAGFAFWPGSPGYLRGVCAGSAAGEWIVTTGLGSIARHRPAMGESDFVSHGHDQLMGVAVTSRGAIIAAEAGAGRVLLADGDEVRTIAEGLDYPMGVALDGETVYVAEAGSGKITGLRQGRDPWTVAEGLGRPEGLCFYDGDLFTVDTHAKAVIRIDSNGALHSIATNLPVGAPAGVTPHFLGPIGDMAGPMVNFADITAGPDGTLYVSADGEGSVLAVRAS